MVNISLLTLYFQLSTATFPSLPSIPHHCEGQFDAEEIRIETHRKHEEVQQEKVETTT